MTRLLLIGVSHKATSVALREKLALTAHRATGFAEDLIQHEPISEAIVLSTCNRTEIYAAVPAGATRERLTELTALLARETGVESGELTRAEYARSGSEVERHLYRVTAGLDSMVLGESEIQGQVKRALEAALSAGTTGPLTSRLFSTALKAGKRVRSETGLGSSRTSVASIAVDLAAKHAGALDQLAVMLIGTGDTGSLVAQALASRGARTTFIANRRVERAHELADQYGGSVARLDDLARHMERADVILTATASPHIVIEAPDLRPIMKRREQRPLVLIDLALPRDIDPSCHEIRGVTAYDLDDLQRVVDATFTARDSERGAAETIVSQEVDRFASWLATRRQPRPNGEVQELSAAARQDRSGKPQRSSSA
jgi:glutamyl-tRNA reductase